MLQKTVHEGWDFLHFESSLYLSLVLPYSEMLFEGLLTILLVATNFFFSSGSLSVDLVSIEQKGKTFKSTEDCKEPNFTVRLGA